MRTPTTMSRSASRPGEPARRSPPSWGTDGWTSWRGCWADGVRRRPRARMPRPSSSRPAGGDVMRIAVYPGTFDPVTYGHLDLVERGAKHVDRLIIAILRNEDKQTLFSVETRTAMLREAVASWGNVVVDSFDGLLDDY